MMDSQNLYNLSSQSTDLPSITNESFIHSITSHNVKEATTLGNQENPSNELLNHGHLDHSSLSKVEDDSVPVMTVLNVHRVNDSSKENLSLYRTSLFQSENIKNANLLTSMESLVPQENHLITSPKDVQKSPLSYEENVDQDFLSQISKICDTNGLLKDDQVISPLLKLMILSKTENQKKLILNLFENASPLILEMMVSNEKLIHIVELWLLDAMKNNLLVTEMLKVLDVIPFSVESLSHCKIGRIIKKMSITLSTENQVHLCHGLLIKWKKLIDSSTTETVNEEEQTLQQLRPIKESRSVMKKKELVSSTLVEKEKSLSMGSSDLNLTTDFKSSNISSVNKPVHISNNFTSSFEIKPKTIKTASHPSSTSIPRSTKSGPSKDGLNLFDDLFKPSLPLPSSQKVTSKILTNDPSSPPLVAATDSNSFQPVSNSLDVQVVHVASDIENHPVSSIEATHISVEVLSPMTEPPIDEKNEPEIAKRSPALEEEVIYAQKKRVSFAPDEFLCDIKYFETESEERSFGRINYKDADKSEAVAAFKKGMNASIDWTVPQKLIFDSSYHRLLNNDSQEKYEQEFREKFIMSIHFMDEQQTPDTPTEPDLTDTVYPYVKTAAIPLNPPNLHSDAFSGSLDMSFGLTQHSKNGDFFNSNRAADIQAPYSSLQYNRGPILSNETLQINGMPPIREDNVETEPLFGFDPNLLNSLVDNPSHIQDIMESVSIPNFNPSVDYFSGLSNMPVGKRPSSNDGYREAVERKKKKEPKLRNICLYYKSENPSLCKNGSDCPFLHINKA